MKVYEYTGMIMAMLGFGLISMGYLFTGFTIGLLSCFVLIPFFAYAKMNGMVALQFYFMCANMLGIMTNWGTM